MDNKDPLPSQVDLCPSCGLYPADRHGSQEDCIRALEAEVRKLTAIRDEIKKASDAMWRARRDEIKNASDARWRRRHDK